MARSPLIHKKQLILLQLPLTNIRKAQHSLILTQMTRGSPTYKIKDLEVIFKISQTYNNTKMSQIKFIKEKEVKSQK